MMDCKPTSSRTRPTEARASSKSGALVVLTKSSESERHDVWYGLMLIGSFVRSCPETAKLSGLRER